ncbi:hypothetical protein [Methylorubrum populi]|uniref:hypothetical protein n=1 Tax=Methylorubrum populi TaxID=223967 RepID=UPI0012651FBC|nr:hypothetical protein [Methylorubrum populi]
MLPLASLTEADFEAIGGLVHSTRSFSPKKEEIEIVGERTGLGSSSVEYLFITLSFLYDHVGTAISSGMGYEEAISATVEDLSASTSWSESEKDLLRGRLGALLQPSNIHRDFRKVERIRAGFQPHAVGFSSIVGLRPKFSDDEAGELTIEGLVPAIEFRITTDAKDNKNHVFQLTEEALSEMKKAIDRLERKVSAVKQANISNARIIEL